MSQEHIQKRLVRVLTTLLLIQEQPQSWTRARLAEHFGVSERMVDHDLRLLRSVGYTIRRTHGGYVCDASPELPGPPRKRDYGKPIREALLRDPSRSNSEIARQFGVSAHTVWYHRRALGLPPSPRGNRLTEPTPERVAAVRQALIEQPDRSLQDIATEFGVTKNAVFQQRKIVGEIPARRTQRKG